MNRALLLIPIVLLFGFPTQGEERRLTLKQAQADFGVADEELNEAWAQARAKLPASLFAELKDEQRAWVEHRDYLALSPGYSGVESDAADPKKSVEYLSAAAALTEERVVWLKGLMRKESESMTGKWSDSYGGHMEIVEREGKLHFTIEVVRGPTAHLGGIAGIASWNYPIGWFSDKGRDNAKTTETNLAFVLRNGRLQITGANTSEYHGARAYFDGRYVRVSDLDEAAQAKVQKAAKTGEISEE